MDLARLDKEEHGPADRGLLRAGGYQAKTRPALIAHMFIVRPARGLRRLWTVTVARDGAFDHVYLPFPVMLLCSSE